MRTKHYTVGYLVSGTHVLMKHNLRGVSQDKWLGLGGKIEQGEKPEASLRREVLEEAGITIQDVFHCGTVTATMLEKGERWVVEIYVIKGYAGNVITSTAEGELRWFPINSLPTEMMWDDARHWIHTVLEGRSVSVVAVYANGINKAVSCDVLPR